jgi:hypothetical protein
MYFTDAIRQYLGWCPNAQPKRCNVVIRPDDNLVVPVDGGSFKARAMHWLGLFRNQIMLYAPVLSATGFWMFAGLGEGSYPLLFVSGMIVGILFSVYVGIWYKRVFDEVLHDGAVVLMNRYNVSETHLMRFFIYAPPVVMMLVFIGAVPGVNLTMTNAVIAGFVSVLLWGLYVTIWKWESETHKTLQFDGMILELEKEEKHVSC